MFSVEITELYFLIVYNKTVVRFHYWALVVWLLSSGKLATYLWFWLRIYAKKNFWIDIALNLSTAIGMLTNLCNNSKAIVFSKIMYKLQEIIKQFPFKVILCLLERSITEHDF